MEIQAVVEGLKLIISRRSPVDPGRITKVIVKTDSMYVYENFGKALHTWPATGWRTKDGGPVLNKPQWNDLRRIVKRLWNEYNVKVGIEWASGKKTRYRRCLDKLAKRSADSPLKRKEDPARIRKKWSPNNLEQGSVKMRGQEQVIVF